MFEKIFIVLVCLELAVFARKRTKQWTNPLTVFSLIWSMLFLLAGLELYDIYSATSDTYMLLFCGVIFFSIGFFITYGFRRKHSITISIKQRSSINSNWKIRYPFIYILGLICLIYFGVQFVKVATVLFSGNGLAAIRQMAQNASSVNSTSGSKIINALRILIILPGSLAIIPLTAVDMWFGRKDKKLIFLCIGIILLRVLSEGGRILIVYFALHLFIGFIFAEKSAKQSEWLSRIRKIRKKKKTLRCMVLGLLIFLVWSTFSRTGSNLMKTTYYYFSMQPYMFETWAKEADARNITGFGVASFNGFIFPVLYLLKNMLGIPFPNHFDSVYQLILDTDSQWQVITKNIVRANAYVSNFWVFYVDGKIFGVVLFSLLYGVIAGNIYSSAVKHTNIKTVCMYSFFLQCIVLSFSGFAFSSLYYCIAFVVLSVLAFKKVNR